MSDFQILVFGSFPITFRPGTLDIQEKVNQRATLDFQRDDLGVDDVWNIGVPIEAWEYGRKRFGGMVQEADLSVYPGAGGKRNWTIKCIDYNALADRIVIGEEANDFKRSWNNEVVGQIAQDVGAYLNNDNVDVVTSVVIDSGLVAASFSVDCASISQALNELQKLATSLSGEPYIWFIDYDKILHFEPWTQRVSPISLSETNGNCRANTIKLTSTGEQFTTRVINKITTTLGGGATGTSVVVTTGDIGARQAVEGGSGLYDLVLDSSSTPTTQQDASQQNDAELARRTGESHILTLDTPESEIRLGESVFFDVPAYDTDSYLCRSIRTKDEGGVFIWRSLELVKGPIVMDSVEYFRALLGSGQAKGVGAGSVQTSGPFQRTLLIKDTAKGSDVTDHIIIYLNPNQPVTIRRVSMVLRKTITADLTVLLNYLMPNGSSGSIGTFTVPSSTAVNKPIQWTANFAQANLTDETVIWADITASDGSKDKDGIASLTVEWVARGANQNTTPGLMWQGPYSSTATYSNGDTVSYNGSTFLSLVDDNTGTTPGTDPTKWALVAAAGTNGTGATGGTGTGDPGGSGTSSWGVVDTPSSALAWTGSTASGAGASASWGIAEIPAFAFVA